MIHSPHLTRRHFLISLCAAGLSIRVFRAKPVPVGTGRRLDPDGSYWITYPDGREVQVCGANGANFLPYDETVEAYKQASVYDAERLREYTPFRVAVYNRPGVVGE